MVDVSEIHTGNEVATESTPEDDIFNELLDDEVANAMDSLPEDYHAVVVLSDIEDLPYKEIAGILDIPIGTVMSRLHRGRKLLREILREYARKRGYLRG